MKISIRPGTARGEMAAPPSKSMGHRLLICGGLGSGESVIRGIDRSEDMLATIDCLEALGARARWEGNAVRITGCDPAKAGEATLPCRESGSTLRFMIPLCLTGGREMRLTGSEKLMSRPLGVYEDLCRERGFLFAREKDGLRVRGRLEPGEYTVPGGISSQFITGLAYALCLLPGESAIRILPPVESRPYLDMTIGAMQAFGIPADWDGETRIRIRGGGAIAPREAENEGDYSNAAFLEALNDAGGAVKVTGLQADSSQGDRVFGEYFRRLREGDAVLDVTDCPDLAPVLMSVAALNRGGRLTGTRRLAFKESDRGAAMREELAKFGVRTENGENGIRIPGGTLREPREVLQSHNDHRIAMALSVLCARTGGIIEGAEAVRKSLPDWWERLRKLGIKTEELE